MFKNPKLKNMFHSTQLYILTIVHLCPETDYLTEGIRGFHKSVEANVWIVPKIRTQRLPSTSFSIYYSYIAFSFDAT
jgi:hypothetical protein